MRAASDPIYIITFKCTFIRHFELYPRDGRPRRRSHHNIYCSSTRFGMYLCMYFVVGATAGKWARCSRFRVHKIRGELFLPLFDVIQFTLNASESETEGAWQEVARSVIVDSEGGKWQSKTTTDYISSSSTSGICVIQYD